MRHDRCLALGSQRSLLHGAAEGPASPFRAEGADRPGSIPVVRQLSQGGLQESGNSLSVRFACAGEHPRTRPMSFVISPINLSLRLPVMRIVAWYYL
jgi:hypothetical protein